MCEYCRCSQPGEHRTLLSAWTAVVLSSELGCCAGQRSNFEKRVDNETWCGQREEDSSHVSAAVTPVLPDSLCGMLH